jgi:hypothetical protein
MREVHLSIAGMLWIVAVVGLWLASLRSLSTLSTSIAATITLASLLTGVLAVVLLRGKAQAFWLGFVLFGTVYLLLVNWDWIGGQFGHDLTAGLSDFGERLVPPDPNIGNPAAVFAPQPGATPAPARMPVVYYESAQQRAIRLGNFVQIGRMSLCLLFALAGGGIARLLAGSAGRSREEQRDSRSPSSVP